MDKQLLEYVEQESRRGVSQGMIKKALRSAGWDEHSIGEVFLAIESRVTPPLPRPQEPSEEESIIEEEFENIPETYKKSKRFPVKVIFIVILVVVIVAAAAFVVFSYKTSSVSQAPVEKLNSPAVETRDNANLATSTQGEGTTGLATTTVGAMSNDEIPIGNIEVLSGTETATSTPGQQDVAMRDIQRMRDMARLFEAQKSWRDANGQYYTCGLAGGDCKGKPYGYPAQIGQILALTPKDPLVPQSEAKQVCGKDFVYCGLNNAPYPQFFCYYAKLEGGGYYTASQGGNFKRSTLPKIFEECAVGN